MLSRLYVQGGPISLVGALHRHDHPPMPTKITARPNGPYIVEGECELVDSTGIKVDTTGKQALALCRCGGSMNKPFCDGPHSKLGFKAAEAAVIASKKP